MNRKEKELLATEKSRQAAEMHRLYAAFLGNDELTIEEAEELLKKNETDEKDGTNDIDGNCAAKTPRVFIDLC